MSEIISDSTYYIINRPICKYQSEKLNVVFYTYKGEFLKKIFLDKLESELRKWKSLDERLDPGCAGKKIIIKEIVFRNNFVFFVDQHMNVVGSCRYEGKMKVGLIVDVLEKKMVAWNLDVEHVRRNVKVRDYDDNSCVIL
ncbi:MAG: hypothetical protein Harvfovirus53_3 [Harvfovirus sp.]|uniref:Uncharacterized protein n=1 Tax=Harvfovirus sp. TaxID=2487768 RepID=A0A3G5A768_9VIRU|nr:MAG: hypothetical protein Harvfovirus53_3 [Harvfovirus sp.]